MYIKYQESNLKYKISNIQQTCGSRPFQSNNTQYVQLPWPLFLRRAGHAACVARSGSFEEALAFHGIFTGSFKDIKIDALKHRVQIRRVTNSRLTV